MKIDMVKPMPPIMPTDSQFDREQGEAADTDQLAEDETEDNPQRDRFAQQQGNLFRHDRYPGIGQRKQRDDDKGHRDMQTMFQALQRRLDHVDTVDQ